MADNWWSTSPLAEDDDDKWWNESPLADQPEAAPAPVDEAAEAQAARDAAFAGRKRRQEVVGPPAPPEKPGLIGQLVGDIVDTVAAPFRPERSVMDPLKGLPRGAPQIEARGGPVTEEYAEGVRRGMELSSEAVRSAAVAQPGVRGTVASVQGEKVRAAENSASKTVRQAAGGLKGRTEGFIAQGETAEVARMRAISDIIAGRIGGAIQTAEVPYDEELSDTIARRVGDIGLAGAQIPAEIIRGIADVTQLVTAGSIGGDLSAAMTEANRKIQGAKSTGAQIQDAEFQRLMQSDTATGGAVLNYLLNNPGLLLEKAIPSAGSMVLPLATATLAGRLATTARWLQSLPTAERAARVAQVQEAVVIATGASQNAAEAFTNTKGGLGDKYSAAAIAGVGSLIAGKLTGGGVEGAIVRGDLTGLRGAASRVAAGGRVLAREFGQEFGEGFSGDLGQQFGETGAVDPRAAIKPGLVEGALGAVVGGGVAGANALLPERVEQAAPRRIDPIIDQANVAPASVMSKPAQPPAPTALNFTPPDSLSAQAGLTPIVVPSAPTAPAQTATDVEREFGLDALRMPGAAPATTTAPAPASAGSEQNISLPQPTAGPAPTEPAATWLGRGGNGYQTKADAQQALPGRERREPALNWSVEQMPSGKYRLAGYTIGEQGAAGRADNTQNQQLFAQEPASAPAQAAATTTQPEAQQPGGAPAVPAGGPVTVGLFRGVPAGRDAASTEGTVGGARFMSPSQAVAQAYAGDAGQVVQERVTFNNLLTAPTWMAAKEQLGLPKSATMPELVEAARGAGYDGVSFTTTNGTEYIQIPQRGVDGQGAGAAGLGVAVQPGAGDQAAAGVAGAGDRDTRAAGLVSGVAPGGAAALGGAEADAVQRDLVAIQDSRLRLGETVKLEVVDPADTEDASWARRVAGEFRAPIVFVRDRNKKAGFNAITINGRLYMNVDSDAPLVALTLHEVKHNLPKDLRDRLTRTIMETVTPEQRARFLEQFPGYRRLRADKQDEELAARIIEQDGSNRGLWRKLRDRLGNDEFGKLAGEILKVIDRIVAAFQREDSSEFTTDIEKVRNALADVMAEARSRIKAAEAPAAAEGDVQPSGKRRNIDRELRERGEYAESKQDARRMLAEGYEMFVASEMDDRPMRVRRPEQFEGYQPEQIIGLAPTPRDEPMASDVRAAGEQRVGKVGTHVLNVARGERKTATRTTISAEERSAIAAAAKALGVSRADIETIVREHKAAHPVADGWAPLVFTGAALDEDNGKVSVQYKAVPYEFNQGKDGRALTPGTPDYAAKAGRLGRGMVDEVRRVFVRAQSGEQAAKNIIAQSGWYKQMRTRLRQEFGGMGDLFADLLGATSPNTPVRTNWDNSVEALRLATQGEFDALLPQWVAFFENLDAVELEARAFFTSKTEEGLKKNAIAKLPEFVEIMDRLKAARDFPDELLPLKSNGKKFGFNGYNVVRAMVDLWRVVKNEDQDIARGGTAPKAINFSGNLIGFRARATIDVWAARMLQRLAGGARVPSMAEDGVSGNAREDGTNTLQFGFGQDVFSNAVAKIRGDAQLSQDPVLAAINDDDLQALVWFIEKEVWTVNNWTSAAGEGGSFEFESDLAGIRNRERVIELRKEADSSVASTAEQRDQAERDIVRLRDEMAAFPAIVAQQRIIDENNAKVLASKAEKDRAKKLTKEQSEAIRTQNAAARKAQSAARKSKAYKALQSELSKARGVLAKPTTEQRQAMRAAALGELGSMARTVDRYTLGLSVQQGAEQGVAPTVVSDAEMAALADDIREAAIAGDPGGTVIGLKAIATEGRYGAPERSLDAEVIVRDGYDPRPLAIATFEAAQAASQDAAFVARVLRPDEQVDLGMHRPGVEIYFRDMRQAQEAAEMMRGIAGLRTDGGFEIGGYTVIVDGRPTAAARAGQMGVPVGMRILYMPEFEARYGVDERLAGATEDKLRDIVMERTDALREFANTVLTQFPGVSFSGVFFFEVETRFAGEYQEAIDAYAEGRAGTDADPRRGQVWKGRSNRESIAGAVGRNAIDGGQPGAELPGGGAGDADVLASERRGAGPAEPADRPGDVRDGVGVRGFARRPVQADAAEVVGVHYGKYQVGSLSGRQYGTGIKGAEAERLAMTGDARIKRRVYFYLHDPASGALPTPEAGLGQYVYQQTLSNVYDPSKSGPERQFMARAAGDANRFESLVLDAGFDGYVAPKLGMIVMLDTDVPVQYLGTRQELNIRRPAAAEIPQRVRLGLLSAEIRQAEGQMEELQAAAPSVELRNGSLVFDEADRDAVAEFFPRASSAQVMASERRAEDITTSGPFAGYPTTSPVPRVSPSVELSKLLEQLDDGELTSEQFEMRIRRLTGSLTNVVRAKAENRNARERERGPDIVREKLLAARRRGELTAGNVEFALWALARAPHLAEGLGISVRQQPQADGMVAGDYNPVSSVMRVFKGSQRSVTAVHEILHHTERMMPEPVQRGIAAEWGKTLARAFERADQPTRDALSDLVVSSVSTLARERAMRAFRDGVLNYEQHYQLTNPSEFWAVNATDILAGRYAAQGSWVAQARQWMREMLERAKAFLGLRSKAPIVRALNQVLAGDGQRMSPAMLSDRMRSALREEMPPAQDIEQSQGDEPMASNRRTGWRDEVGRVQFAPGAKVYAVVADIASNVLDVLRMKPIDRNLARAMRKMKVEVDAARQRTVTVAGKLQELSPDERQMISDVIEGELRAGVTPPQRVLGIAASMTAIMGEQTQELIRLDMLDPDSARRWEGKYLPRFYEKNFKDEAEGWLKAARELLGRKKIMQGIGGSNLKARGIFRDVPVEELEQWVANGWEERDPKFDPAKDDTIRVWRDYDRDERESMGEIRDAMFRFVMGYTKAQKDIALGRLYERLANDIASRNEEPGFVFVPDTTIDGTSAKRYGKLAGMWVPREVLDHLREADTSQHNEALKLYRKALSMWKEGKTVLNPVSHANNVISNLTMAHMAGVSYWDTPKYALAAMQLAMGTPEVEEARAAGLFGGTFSQAEMLEMLPPELQQLANMQESKVAKAVDSAWNVASWFLRKPMGQAYEAEDMFFRYLIYSDARKRGLDVDDAIEFAQQYIFTYDDLPKGARAVRDFMLPFFAYTYKAVPVIAHTTLAYPWRMAAPAAVTFGVNAIMYAIAQADAEDDDEKSRIDTLGEIIARYVKDPAFRERVRTLESNERENLPSWMRGYTSLGTPKAIRLGTDDVTNLPMFLDIARMFPGGDLLDATNNAGGVALLQPITPSHPLLTTAVAMLANRDMFFGKDIVDKTMTTAEATAARSAWLWKQFTPAVAAGNYHWDRAMNTIATATGEPVSIGPFEYTGFGKDGLPVQPGLAGLQTVGIKARPIDLDMSAEIEKAQRDALIRELDTVIRRLNRLENNQAITPGAADREREKVREKKDRLREGLDINGNERK